MQGEGRIGHVLYTPPAVMGGKRFCYHGFIWQSVRSRPLSLTGDIKSVARHCSAGEESLEAEIAHVMVIEGAQTRAGRAGVRRAWFHTAVIAPFLRQVRRHNLDMAMCRPS